MKTTLYIEDELFRDAKVQAAREGIRLKDLIEAGLRVVLAGGHLKKSHRIQFPLIKRSGKRSPVTLEDIKRAQTKDLEEEAAHAKSLRR